MKPAKTKAVESGAQQAADRAYREGQMFRDLREAVGLLEEEQGEFCGGSKLNESCPWKPRACWWHRKHAFFARLDSEPAVPR